MKAAKGATEINLLHSLRLLKLFLTYLSVLQN